MDLRGRFAANAEQFDDLMMEMLNENRKLKNLGARFAGCLWDYCKVCPECGNKRESHMPGCKLTYEREYRSPSDCEAVFNKAFGVSA